VNSNAEFLQVLKEQLSEAMKARDLAGEVFRKDPAAGFFYQDVLMKAHEAARLAAADAELLCTAVHALATMDYGKKEWAPSLRVVKKMINEATNADLSNRKAAP